MIIFAHFGTGGLFWKTNCAASEIGAPLSEPARW
jgi:hypothetical protein